MSPITTGDTASLKKAQNSILDWSKDNADLKGAISRIFWLLLNKIITWQNFEIKLQLQYQLKENIKYFWII